MAKDYLLYLRTETAQSVFRLGQEIMSSLRAFLDAQGFVEFLPPIISTVTDPGLRGAERVPVCLYDSKVYLTSSMVFHKQILASAFDKIYCFSPNVRLEPCANARSGKHLVEFCQLDLEEANCTCDDSIDLAERMLVNIHRDILSKCQEMLSVFGRTLAVPHRPFPRFSYDSLISKARDMGVHADYGEELPEAVETAVSREIDSFFWITDYPQSSRGFYYKDNAGSDKVRSMDLIYPEGFGEAISGGEREFEPHVVRQKARARGLELEGFEQFLSAAGPDLQPSSGFGIGIERLLRYITGLKDIGLVRAFPKIPGQIRM